MNEVTSTEQIREIAYAFQKSRILLTAFELKVFTVIDNGMLSSEEISKKINTDQRATDRLLSALCGLGLLIKEGAKFSNTEVASKYLVEGKPEYMGNLFHTNDLWNTWSYLTKSVTKGSGYIGDKNKKDEKDWVESFIGAMHYRGVKQAQVLSGMIDLANTKKMLDIGGGSAAFSMEFVKKNPAMKAVVLDLPHVIPLTKRYVKQERLTDNFDFIEGNYLVADYGNGYDLIFLSAIVHINSYDQNKMIVEKCANALNEHGMVIINDFVMDEDRIHPLHGAIFSLNMLVGTKNGDTYTEGEMREWFTSAGFTEIKRKKTGISSDLMIGIK